MKRRLNLVLEEAENKAAMTDLLVGSVSFPMPWEVPKTGLCEHCLTSSVLSFSKERISYKWTNRCRDAWLNCRDYYSIMLSQRLHEDMFYAMMRHESPPIQLPDNSKILCIGGGGAVWAGNYASTHPSASVLSKDVGCFIHTKATGNHQVQTVHDLCGKFLDELPRESQDFVRVTKLSGRIADWDLFLSQVYRVLKPGSFLELCDTSKEFSEKANSPWHLASSLFDSFGRVRGVAYNMLARPEVGERLGKAGFRQFRQASLELALNTPQGWKYASTIISELDMIKWAVSIPIHWDVFTGRLGRHRCDAKAKL